MANPFATGSAVAQDVADLAFEAPKKFRRNKYEILNAQHGVDGVKESLIEASRKIENLPKGKAATEAQMKALEEAGGAFNLKANQLGFAEGKLGASIKGMFKSLGDTLGFDTSKIGARAIKGDVSDRISKVYTKRASVVERLISKPFRVAANNPKTALVVGGLLSVIGLGGYLKGRAENRTEREAQEALARAQVQAQPSYMNSVSQADMDAMNARMQADGKVVASHAAAVDAARAQMPAPEQKAAGL